MATDVPPGELRPHSEKTFESSRIASKPDGWITTNGVFYPCGPDEHDVCASYLLKAQEKYVESLLIEGQHYSMMGDKSGQPARTVLKTAGFALLSDNQLAESNLPEQLSLKQMEFAERNHLIFMPKSGQLSLKEYQAFLGRVSGLEGVKRLIERKNVVVNNFLDNPTQTIHVEDNDSFAQKVFAALSEGSTSEISIKLSKSKVIWRQLDLPDNPSVFLEYEFHDHGYDSYPETESFIMLVGKQSVKKFLNEKQVAGYRPQGNLDVLN